MTPFAIAGVQLFVSHGDNLEAMRHRLRLLDHLYPWVQMVVFSELCVFGPGDSDVVVRPGPRMAEAARIMAQCINDKMARKTPAPPSTLPQASSPKP